MMTYFGLTLLACLCPTSQSWVQTLPRASTTTRQPLHPYSKPYRTACSSTTSIHALVNSNNNVVLRPSENPNAFDSFKIGSARVHRYVREDYAGGGESSAEYVMWFHGRSKAHDGEDSSMPPLSTGRIGSATSLNGLQWEKITDGSLAEDVSDVSLGLNQESWWGFDTKHLGLGQVLLPMSTPSVITEGGVYIMYYFGGSEEETPLADYVGSSTSAAADSDATIKGMKMRIGVAISQDGKTWGRVEGEDPTGACVAPYDKADPNQKSVSFMRDENDALLQIEEELYCAWPEVAVRIGSPEQEQPTKGKTAPSFFMYHSTMRKRDKAKCIALAVSNDGFTWSKRGVCLEPDVGGLDAAGCARCNVLQKASYQDGVWKTEDGWIMLYEGVSKEDGKHRILMAESKDGRTWEKKGLAFDTGASDDAWDSGGVGSPHVIRLDDGSMRMYYTGQGADGSTAIGVARVQNAQDMTKWAREQAEFAFV
ncbi:methyltransferase [Fragilaria crotonensis]|nr:methyltransferase [Fragilaria crotonensis]